MAQTTIVRRKKQEWEAENPVLRDGEPAIEIGNNRFKVGDGVSPWSKLPYIASPGSISLEGIPTGNFVRFEGGNLIAPDDSVIPVGEDDGTHVRYVNGDLLAPDDSVITFEFDGSAYVRYENGNLLAPDDSVIDVTPEVTTGRDVVSGPAGVPGGNFGATPSVPSPRTAGSEFDIYEGVLNATATFTLPAGSRGDRFSLRAKQDATGGRTITLPAGLSYPVGQPVLLTAANALNELAFYHDGTTWCVYPITDGSGNPAPLVETVNTVTSSGASVTLPDVSVATMHDVTLTANCTFTFPTAAPGKSFTLRLAQDATGSRTVTWPAGTRWASATAPTLSTGAGKVDVLTFFCIAGANWSGGVVGLDIR